MCKPICRTAAALVLMAAMVAAQTHAKDWNTVKALAPGTEVQIMAGSRTVRGKIDRVTDDTLVVTSGKGQEMFTQAEVTQVSVKKPGHRKRNALIGLAVGTGAGLGIGLAADRCSGSCFGPNLNGVVTAGFAVAGALVGTIICVAIPSGGWREVYKR
jgi:preprotein translocase subunit YajC